MKTVRQHRGFEPRAPTHLEVFRAHVVTAQIDAGVEGAQVDQKLTRESGRVGSGQAERPGQRCGPGLEAAAHRQRTHHLDLSSPDPPLGALGGGAAAREQGESRGHPGGGSGMGRPPHHSAMLKTLPEKLVAYCCSGLGAGPLTGRPLVSKVEPWQGHTKRGLA